SGQDACLTYRIAQVRVLPGRLPGSRSAGVPAAHLLGREGDRVRFSGGPSWDRGGGRGSVPRSVHLLKLKWATGPTGRHRYRKPEIGVRLPGGPLAVIWAHGPRGRRRPGVAEIRVRLPVGPLKRKVVGYGLPSRPAKAVPPKEG